MNINEINLTKVFIRFLKIEGLYDEFKKRMTEYFIFYDGVIDNLLITPRNKKRKPEELLDVYIIYNVLLKGTLRYIDYDKLTSEWKTFLKVNKLNNIELIKPNNTYFNIATPIIISFLKDNNALNEVINVLHKQGKINNPIIQDNDFDRILRKHKCSITDFFSDEMTFGDWLELEQDEPNNITWLDLNDKFIDYMYENFNNYYNVIP